MPMALLHSKIIRSTLALAVLLLLTHDDVASAMPSPWPVPAQTVPGKLNGNPFAGVTGTGTMHADCGSSDCIPFAGSGNNEVEIEHNGYQAACPTLLIASNGMLMALCTDWIDTGTWSMASPSIKLINMDNVRQRGGGLINPANVDVVAEFKLTKGGILGGVYSFLDSDNNMVVIDGNNQLKRIGMQSGSCGGGPIQRKKTCWQLLQRSSTDLRGGIGSATISGLAPDWAGRVWFATSTGIVGYLNLQGAVKTVTLGLQAGEKVANSISSSPIGVSVTTNQATYLLKAMPGTSNPGVNQPTVIWRQGYDFGVGRKPGQLSWGSGSTPTFFGPTTGYEYLTIVDNAFPIVNLLVYNASSGKQLCKQPIFDADNSGSENSPIAVGNSIVVASTYGYQYPAKGLPANAGRAVCNNGAIDCNPNFVGGLVRVDIDSADQSCAIKWYNRNIPSAAVPKLSVADGYLYTFATDAGPGIRTNFYYNVIKFSDGSVLKRTEGWRGDTLKDTLQMAGVIHPPSGAYIQGTKSGISFTFQPN